MPRGYCVHAWSHQISGGMSIILYFLLLLSRDNVMERTKQIQLFCIFFPALLDLQEFFYYSPTGF